MFGDSSGRSTGGARALRLFLDQNEARRTEKSFCEAGPRRGGGGHLGICRPGLQISTPFKKKNSPKIDTPF